MSELPVNTCWPSGEKANESTDPLCPSNFCSSLPDSTSHSRADLNRLSKPSARRAKCCRKKNSSQSREFAYFFACGGGPNRRLVQFRHAIFAVRMATNLVRSACPFNPSPAPYGNALPDSASRPTMSNRSLNVKTRRPSGEKATAEASPRPILNACNFLPVAASQRYAVRSEPPVNICRSSGEIATGIMPTSASSKCKSNESLLLGSSRRKLCLHQNSLVVCPSRHPEPRCLVATPNQYLPTAP